MKAVIGLKVIRCLLSLLLLLQLGACSSITRERPMPDDPAYAPVLASSLVPPEAVTGSIFQTNRNFGFYSDQVALNVGDILTVTLSESTSSSKSADTAIDKKDEITMNEASVLGDAVTLGRNSLLTDPSADRQFEGTATSDQSNSLRGSISVTVVEVLPNGVLRVQGEKWLSLNQGDEFIRLTGLVRPQDIGTDNTISSAKIADARIAYGGTGALDQSNRQGWLSRFLGSEWWMF